VATPVYKRAYSGVLKVFMELLPQTAGLASGMRRLRRCSRLIFFITLKAIGQ
jgi:NAD(P)H-dependent FMN reductase